MAEVYPEVYQEVCQASLMSSVLASLRLDFTVSLGPDPLSRSGGQVGGLPAGTSQPVDPNGVGG